MRILHTADWHLGKKLDRFSRIDEQRLVLEEICRIADEEEVDVVLIAGDLFDHFTPPADAQQLFYRTVHRLSKGGRRPVVAIAGNHDMPERIEAPIPLAEANAIILLGFPHSQANAFESEGGVRVTRSEPGFLELVVPGHDVPLRLLLTPYANELRLKTFLGGEQGLNALLSEHWQRLSDTYCDDQGVNMLMAHLFFISACRKILSRNHNLVENFLKNEAENFFSLSEKTDIQINDIEDSVKNLEQICKELNSSQDSKEEIEERLFLIRNLSRKFNCNANELEKLALDSQAKLSTLNHEEKLSQELIIKRQEYYAKYQKIAQDLSKKRKKSALELSKKVEEELDFLKMAGTKFLVEIIENKSLNLDEKNSIESKNYFPTGFEKAIFKASLNKNNFDEITKIASGGELSRFMLALKVALMNVKSVPTIIFDEIDTGIGGSTSDAVGKRLKTLSQNSQILVVTHQPQIASKADVHLKISKSEIAGKVKTKIEILDKNSRINEIARMLSGEEISLEAMSASKKLLEENNTK